MAQEISIQLAFTIRNPSTGSGYQWTDAEYLLLTQNTVGANSLLVSVPTTAAGTAYTFTNVTTPGWCFVKNLDATNYVELGVQVGGVFYPFLRVKSGECFPFRLSPSASLYMRANTAAVNTQLEVWSD